MVAGIELFPGTDRQLAEVEVVERLRHYANQVWVEIRVVARAGHGR
jgi:hypothetical protein